MSVDARSREPGPVVALDAPGDAAGARGGGPARLVVRSIGTAGAAMIRALRQVLPVPDAQLAAALYQAPAELVRGIDARTAEAMARLLVRHGLECEVLPADADFQAGVGDLEVALAPQDMRRMGEVVCEVAEILGVDPVAARKIVCASPAVLIGKVSEATVVALRRRFEPLGVELDVSRSRDARFELFLGDGSPAVRAQVVRVLREEGVELLDGEGGPLVAAHLEAAAAARVWERLQRATGSIRLLNQDFQRFEITLEQARPGEALRAFLTETAGIPAHLAPRLLERVPVVTHRSVPRARVPEILGRLEELGCAATARLLSFQTYAATVSAATDLRSASLALQAVAGLTEARAAALLRALPARMPDPLTNLQARWLQAELRRAGATCTLELS